MRIIISVLILAAASLLTAPAPAAAQAYFVPNVGYDAGGDAGDCPSLFHDCSTRKTSYGVTVGSLMFGVVGLEEDIAYAPDFFGQSAAFSSNNVLTAMTNVVVAVPAGPLRPYASGGIGLVRSHVAFNSASLTSFDDTGFGYDFGGGLMVLLPAHLGVRGDVRYYRSSSSITIAGVTINGATLNFSRVSVGLVLH